jgi:hypothetical protein
MKNFVNLSEQKVTTMMRLIDNKELVKAVHYDAADFLEQPDISDPSILIYNHIYPYRYIPDVLDTAKTFITMSFRGYKPVNSYYKSGLIYLSVITHKDLIKTAYGSLRYDFIVQKIDEVMNNKEGLGMGNTQFHDMDEIFINKSFMGMYVAYKLYDFS